MRYALIYGSLTGMVIILALIAAVSLGGHGSVFGTVWFGYLLMLIALTFEFVGVKRYRDVECGGVVKFLPALAVGIGIALVATIAYVAIWEAYLVLTNYTFMDHMIQESLDKLRSAGVTGAAFAKQKASLDAMGEAYRNPLLRMAYTSIEILPVALGVALVSAFALMFPKVLPARGASVHEPGDDVAIRA